MSRPKLVRLRAITAEIAAGGTGRLFAARARAYARRLSEADPEVLVKA